MLRISKPPGPTRFRSKLVCLVVTRAAASGKEGLALVDAKGRRVRRLTEVERARLRIRGEIHGRHAEHAREEAGPGTSRAHLDRVVRERVRRELDVAAGDAVAVLRRVVERYRRRRARCRGQGLRSGESRRVGHGLRGAVTLDPCADVHHEGAARDERDDGDGQQREHLPALFPELQSSPSACSAWSTPSNRNALVSTMRLGRTARIPPGRDARARCE